MPIGRQSFKLIRESNFIYVDKTEFVWKLIKTGQIIFFSRPRRFGKSLFLSTLEAYFKGQKELFEGLKIAELEEKEKEPWQESPVLHIDFNPSAYMEKKDLENLFDSTLRSWEAVYGKNPDDYDISSRFNGIIHRAVEKTGKKVIILVDEYDKPLLATMNEDPELYEAYLRMMKGFYAVIKSCDQYIRFVFITGVTKFSRVSIFSDLNNLQDISLDKEYAELCGITQEELEATFQPEIKALMENNGKTKEEIMQELKLRYNGYLFHQNGKAVYNPFSLLSSFTSKEFRSYWFATGTPTFLIELLQKSEYDLRNITEGAELTERDLFDYRPNAQNPVPIFFQAGYLTIKDYSSEFHTYTLSFPNMEVKQGFFFNMMHSFTSVVKDETGLYIRKFIMDLREKRIDDFMERMYAACSGIPYSLASKKDIKIRERDYQIAFYIIFTLMGYHAETEPHTSKGRADLVVQTNDTVYIFEFKLMSTATAEDALNQIKEKGYAEKYKKSGKEIILVGAVFGDDITDETPDRWRLLKI